MEILTRCKMNELKTLKDLDSYNEYLGGTFIGSEELKAEAVKILKIKKEINTADWIEFFGIEKEFSEICFGTEEDLKDE